jgi:pimeloyl-ACP methyl ester carboxylesterase
MAAAGAWWTYSRFGIRHDLPLPAAIDAERREVTGRAGRLSLYIAGDGPPLLLVHSINAAGSAFEVKPIFDAFRGQRRVVAIDLPGYGFSDRSARRYEPRLFTDAILDALDVIATLDDAPVDALAVSLSSEFLARAAAEHPERFGSLALVTPTGFSRGAHALREAPGSTREVRGLARFFEVPLWSQALYDALVSRPSIRYFLQRTYGRRDVDEAMVDYDYLTTHQPGARHAPYAFLSGRLFSKDIRSVYERLRMPIWVPHATRGDFKDFLESAWTRDRPNWRLEPLPTGALPHFEDPRRFADSYGAFLKAASKAVAGQLQVDESTA